MRITIVVSFLLFFILNYLVLFSQKGNSTVFLHGTIKNFDTVVTVEDMSEMEALELPDPRREFTADSNGRFSVSFDIDAPNYFRIGRSILFLSPGDRLEVYIDRSDPKKAWFNGDHWQENMYLRTTPYPVMRSFLENGDSIKPTIKATILSVLESAKRRKHDLDSYKDISDEFRTLENARIKADVINSLVWIPHLFPTVNKISSESVVIIRSDCENEIKPYLEEYVKNLLRADFMKLRVFRDILPMLHNANIIGHVGFFDDWKKAKELVHAIKSVNNQNVISEFEADLQSIKTEKYRVAVSETFNKLIQLSGMKAIDFSMADSNNNPVSLSSFRGKIIFVDIWATWCGPCIEEQPYLDSLRNHYKDRKDIVFVSLSIDEHRQSWKSWLIEKQLRGDQFVVEREKLERYYLKEIPRTIVINKDFTIFAFRGPQPSNKETIPILDSLLGL